MTELEVVYQYNYSYDKKDGTKGTFVKTVRHKKKDSSGYLKRGPKSQRHPERKEFVTYFLSTPVEEIYLIFDYLTNYGFTFDMSQQSLQGQPGMLRRYALRRFANKANEEQWGIFLNYYNQCIKKQV